MLFARIAAMLGLDLKKAHLRRLYACNMQPPRSHSHVLHTLHVRQLGERVKHVHIISHAEGYALRRTAAPDDVLSVALARNKFEEALNAATSNKGAPPRHTPAYTAVTLRNCAACWTLLLEQHVQAADVAEREERRCADLRYIRTLYEAAVAADPRDTHTLFQYGDFLLSMCDAYDEAEDCLLRSLEADATQVPAWEAYLRLLEKVGLAGEAHECAAVRNAVLGQFARFASQGAVPSST